MTLPNPKTIDIKTRPDNARSNKYSMDDSSITKALLRMPFIYGSTLAISAFRSCDNSV